MKACVLHNINDLRYDPHYSLPPLESGQVQLKIRAAGICGSDIPRVFKKGTYHFPTVIGHEFSGEIVRTADDVDKKWIGKRVVVFPLIPCKTCSSCQAGEYALCEDYDYYGSRRDGAFAEYLNVNLWNVMCIPDTVSYEQAAMCEPCAVALHAIRKADVRPEDVVVISGAGTIGIILAQLASAAGASKVVMLDVDDRKLSFARSIGFSYGINSGNENISEKLRELTGSPYADVVIECSGASGSVANCLKCAKRFGKVVVMGNPGGDIHLPQNNYWEILRKELTVQGTWNSQYNDWNNDWNRALLAMEKGHVNLEQLITHRYDFSDCREAFHMLKSHEEFAVKVLFVNE